MPQQDSNSKLPPVWSSKRTVQCIRRLGIIQPIDDALIDQAATDFVNNSIDETPSEQTQGIAMTIIQLSESTPAANLSSLEGDLSKATCRSNVAGSTVCQDDTCLEGSTHQGSVLHDDKVTLAKDSDKCAANTLAIPLNQGKTSQITTKKDDIVREATKQMILGHDNMTEGVLGKKDVDGSMSMTQMGRDNGSDYELATSDKFSTTTMAKSLIDGIAEKRTRATQTSCGSQDVGYDADTEGSSVADEALLIAQLPSSAEDMMERSIRDKNWSYSARMKRKSAIDLIRNGEEPALLINQIDVIANLSVAEVQEGPDEGDRVWMERERHMQRNGAATDISPTDQYSVGVDDTEGSGEESASCTWT